jgi:hypothetical protein
VTGAHPRRRTALKLVIALAVSVVLFELGARVLLFSPLAADLPLAQQLRLPGVVSHEEEDLYWWLRTHYGLGVGPEGAEDHHAELGWLPWGGDYAHPRREPLGERRRVLLFGDSFAACWTPDGECFEDLLARSELDATHTLLNYGVPAYGLDQIYLLLQRSIDLFADEDPIVIVSLLVDRDLDRAGLSYRGGRSKPRFDVSRGELVLQPPLDAGVFPTRPGAWFGARLLAHALAAPESLHELACGSMAARERNRERCRLLFAAIVDELERRGLESFFLLFHSEPMLFETTWEDELVTSTLDALGARWISTRVAVTSHAEASGRATADYFDATGHFNARGNAAAFRALREGLAGHAGDGAGTAWSAAELRGPLSPSVFTQVQLGGRLGFVRHEFGRRPQFPDPADRERLVFRVGRKGPTEIEFALGGRATAFRANAHFMPLAAEASGGVGITLLGDGTPLVELSLRRGDARRPIEVDLTGRDTLTLRVDDGGDGVRGDTLVFSAPTFELAD